MMKSLRQGTACLLAAAWLLGAAATIHSAEPVSGTEHMVVAANPHASAAGLRILRAGGSAVDAAIAVQLVLSMVEPQSSGIGGGAFMLYFDAAGDRAGDVEIIAYDGRETAPAAASPDMFLGEDGRAAPFFSVGIGGLSVGVPGVMRMLEMAHRDHGRLAWAELFAPAIELAEEGFDVSPRLHSLLELYKNLARGEAFKEHYYDRDGEPRPVGYRLVNVEYAQTLRLLAEGGAEPMYTGELAEAIVREVRDNAVGAGRMTLEDLASFRARRTQPLCTPYREWRVCGPRPPSSGGVTVQQALGLLAGFDLAALADERVQAIHLVAEASRLAFADRNEYLGDPDFVDVPVAGLLSPEYLDGRRSLMDAGQAMETVAPGKPPEGQVWNLAADAQHARPSTSHFSIVDRRGNAVSMTTTVQAAFGSQLMVGGFLLNNQLTDFAFEPQRGGLPVANRPEAGKRPLSSMSPSLVLDADDQLRLVIGSPGGTRIIGYVLQTIVAVLDWRQDIQQAISAPRFLAQTGPLELEEDTELVALRAQLEALGHRVVTRNLNSGLHGITLEHTPAGHVLHGGADPRREGVALAD